MPSDSEPTFSERFEVGTLCAYVDVAADNLMMMMMLMMILTMMLMPLVPALAEGLRRGEGTDQIILFLALFKTKKRFNGKD